MLVERSGVVTRLCSAGASAVGRVGQGGVAGIGVRRGVVRGVVPGGVIGVVGRIVGRVISRGGVVWIITSGVGHVVGLGGGIEGALPVALKGPSPCLDFVPNVHGSRSGVSEGANDRSQFDVTDDLPGVALGDVAGGVEAVVLGDLGTGLEELFMRSLLVLNMKGGCDGKSSDEFHMN